MPMNGVVRAAVMGGLTLLVGAGLIGNTGMVRAQKAGDATMPSPSIPGVPPSPGVLPSEDPMPGPVFGRTEEERRNAINDSRHKRLEEDVAKLQELTNELKTDLDKADKDQLSMDVIHKASEIEKLAHDVQSRMKN